MAADGMETPGDDIMSRETESRWILGACFKVYVIYLLACFYPVSSCGKCQVSVSTRPDVLSPSNSCHSLFMLVNTSVSIGHSHV